MNKFWIGTNWKMTKTIGEGVPYTEELVEESKKISADMELFIIPSYTSLISVKKALGGSNIYMGAQNMHWEDEGAYTGEISPVMLSEIGVDIVELGHSERRQYYNEDDYTVNKKIFAALKHGLKPLVCIGENLKQMREGVSEEVLSNQLRLCVKGLSKKQISNIFLAYEPIWAIGEKGVPANTKYIKKVFKFLKEQLHDLYGEAGNQIPLLYGGSVNQHNFLDYANVENVNGLFIGRSAWEMGSFAKIIHGLDANLRC